MSQILRVSQQKPGLTGDTALRRKRQVIYGDPAKAAKFRADARFQFDSAGWIALLEEQRQRVAAAAGVDASKVKIHLGH